MRPIFGTLALALILATLLPFSASAQGSPPCDSSARASGAVVELNGTPHLWIQDADGRLHWAGDTRALADRPVHWETRCSGDLAFFQRTQMGDPYLSAGLVKIGEPIYLAKWETSDATPTLLHIRSIRDVELFGINESNYGRFVLDRFPWEQRYGFNTDSLPKAELAPAVGGSPVAAACQPRMSETEYLTSLESLTTRVSASLGRVGRLSPASPASSTWRNSYRTEMETLRGLGTQIRQLCPPVRYQGSHAKLSEAMVLIESAASDLTEAIDLTERALQTGDTSLIDRALQLIGQGGQKIDAASPLVSEAGAILRQESGNVAPPPSGTTTSQTGPPSRADSVREQTGSFCKAGTRFSLRVVNATEARRDIIGLVVEVTNLGSRSQDVFRMVDLQDQRSRNFDMTGLSDYREYFDDLRMLRDRGVISDVTDIQPGRTELVYIAFLVAPDSTSFRLVQRRPPCA